MRATGDVSVFPEGVFPEGVFPEGVFPEGDSPEGDSPDGWIILFCSLPGKESTVVDLIIAESYSFSCQLTCFYTRRTYITLSLKLY